MNGYVREVITAIMKMISRVWCMFAGVVSTMLIVSCKPQVPSEYIQPDEMEDILYDYHLVQSIANQETETGSSSFNKHLLYLAVLKKYGVTEAEFDSSLVYYYTHAKTFNEIYSKVESRMEAEAVRLGASAGEMGRYSLLTADGDTANIWRNASSKVLLPVPPYNKYTFTVEADTTFRRGDSFMFNFMSAFVYQNGTKDAVMYMAVTYDNDSISSFSSHISVSGHSQMRIPGNARNDIKRIDGFICLNQGNDESMTQKLMFIDGIQLIRFHPQVSRDTVSQTTATASEKTDSMKPVSQSEAIPSDGQANANMFSRRMIRQTER